MNARENASVNVLSRAVDGALAVLNATAGDSDLENVQWRIRETKRVLEGALREVTLAPASLPVARPLAVTLGQMGGGK